MIWLMLYLLVGGGLTGLLYDGDSEDNPLLVAALWPALAGFKLVMWLRKRGK